MVFSTYQSGKALAEAARASNPRFDLGIFDEAHKTVGDKDGLLAHLLLDEHIAIGRRLFMPATTKPSGSSQRLETNAATDVVLSACAEQTARRHRERARAPMPR